MTMCAWALVVITFPFSLFVCFKVVQEYERAVIFRLGRLVSGGAKGPGIFFILPCIDNYARVDLRTRTYDVPPQEVLTKDSVTVSVDAVVYYRVCNATISVANVANAHQSTRLLAQTTLRNVLGTRPLHEILSDRDAISKTMQVSLDEATESWGIKVERVEIKDVRLPVQLQRAMAAEAEAAREARAKVIAAEGEQKASRALREASEVISDSPAALQLRYLQGAGLKYASSVSNGQYSDYGGGRKLRGETAFKHPSYSLEELNAKIRKEALPPLPIRMYRQTIESFWECF
ncbi:band 7 protein, partial [Aphis craccivora]